MRAATGEPSGGEIPMMRCIQNYLDGINLSFGIAQTFVETTVYTWGVEDK